MKSAIVAIAVLFCLVSRAEADTCVLNRATSVEMSRSESGGVLVPMTINDQAVAMLVDTGGVYSSLKDSAVDKLGLPRNWQVFTGETMFGGKNLTRYVSASRVNFGGLNAYKFNFVVMPDDVLPKEAQGTIAPDVLGANDVDFDFANNKFSLFSQKHCYGGVVYWTRGYFAQIPFKVNEYDHHIEIDVTLDGKPTRAILDTGSTTSIMSYEYARDTLGVDPKSPDLKALDPKEEKFQGYRYPFKTLSFGDIVVTNPHIILVPRSSSKLGDVEPPIIIGMSILSKLHLYIAYGEHNLYITGADAH
ncbi:MAG TPA: aspartyl protease family protein [Rhizomicrobium sp.]|nr:aspartyl protease family protein [Rhizomicrobium sp.]